MKLSLRILVACLFLMLATQASAVYTQDGARKSFDIFAYGHRADH